MLFRQAEHEQGRERNAEMVSMQEDSNKRTEVHRRVVEEQIQEERRRTSEQLAEVERETLRQKSLYEADARIKVRPLRLSSLVLCRLISLRAWRSGLDRLQRPNWTLQALRSVEAYRTHSVTFSGRSSLRMAWLRPCPVLWRGGEGR